MDAAYRKKLEQAFGHLPKADLEMMIEHNTGIDVRMAREWIKILDEREHDAAVDRARSSIEIARDAAEAARDSARYALITALINLLAVVVTVALAWHVYSR